MLKGLEVRRRIQQVELWVGHSEWSEQWEQRQGSGNLGHVSGDQSGVHCDSSVLFEEVRLSYTDILCCVCATLYLHQIFVSKANYHFEILPSSRILYPRLTAQSSYDKNCY